jgi:hypothetical protein
MELDFLCGFSFRNLGSTGTYDITYHNWTWTL